ncbi:MBL fold metallo-hydrolase [Thiocystis violacea]|uniref:MBL fold metallo-hydrolase n=1 Tax=Thiocystis violacea TaxID=13725 RepID=UPI0019041F4E|nr:MBL fold metallo-hydrolase [Thiocystis violacea]MBK1721478.1 MBL fold metallo-hydrolase [Thiocystis violacea]
MTPSIQRFLRSSAALWLLVGMTAAWADALTRVRVATDVYALIGSTGARTAENDALNCNLGFVVTDQGVVLIDSGASREGAKRIAAAIRAVTDRPVKWVINTGSQDHRWLGNGYFAEQGAEIIALSRTAATQKTYGDQHLANLSAVLGERLAGTEPVTASAPLAGDQARLDLGGVRIELLDLGDAHFPGDAVVWLPAQRVLFAGDLVYNDRLLGVLPSSRVASWRAAFHRMEALKPDVLVPGHGSVGDLAKAQRDTGDYLDWLVEQVGTARADWEPLDEVVARLADAPQFSGLENFDSLHRQNINRAYLDFERGGN